TGESIRQFCCHNGWIDGIALSPDGSLLATAGQDGTVRLWRVETGEQIATYDDHTDRVWQVAFSPDGRYLASSSWDYTVRIHALNVGAKLGRSGPSLVDGVQLAMSGDGRTFAMLDQEDQVRVWRNGSGAFERKLSPATGVDEEIVSVALNQRGNRASVLIDSGKVAVWDLEQTADDIANPVFSEATSAVSETAQLQFLTDDDALVVLAAEDDVAIQVVGDVTRTSQYTQALTRLRVADGSKLTDVVLSPDGQYIATTNVSGTVRLADVGNPQPRLITQIPIGEDVDAVTPLLKFSGDGRFMALISAPSTLLVWDVNQDAELTRFRPPRAKIVDFDFSVSGEQIAAVTEEASVTKINLLDLDYVDTASLFFDGTYVVDAVLMTADGILALSGEQTTQVDLATNQELLALTCASASRNLRFDEWRTIKRDLPDINQVRICPELPLHESVLRAYLLEDPDAVSLDLASAGITEQDLVRSELQLVQEKLTAQDTSGALALLSKATESMSAPGPQLQSQVAQHYQQICADDDFAARQIACPQATNWTVQLEDAQRNHGLCQTGLRVGQLNDVLPACERAVELAAAGNNLARNLAFCPTSRNAQLGMYTATCERAVALAGEAEDASALVDVCVQSTQGGYADLVLPICERAADLAAGLETETAFDLNLRLCQATAPENTPNLFAASCTRVVESIEAVDSGVAVSDQVDTEAGDYWRYTATSDLVTIELQAQPERFFHTILTVYDDKFRLLTSVDDSLDTSDSLLYGYAVTPGVTYFLQASGYSGATGDYTLKVTPERLEDLPFDTPVTGSFTDTVSWRVDLEAGDIVDIELEAETLPE
ncbi:MAG: WD40 repeat domain-containing protein, partial [Caldilineaceae bacterium]|nr:WD40 repeat domain-containing protein [Caldilineaceae bacterium]